MFLKQIGDTFRNTQKTERFQIIIGIIQKQC